MSAAGSRNDGFDDDRRVERGGGGSRRRSGSDGAPGRGGDFLRRAGRTGGHHHVGNHHPRWQPGAACVWVRGAMFQIIFNELSAAEMAALPKSLQLDLLAEFQILPEDLDNLDSSRFGVIEREGKKLHRYRAKDYRIYFEKRAEGITVHRVLHKNTFRDFLFRSKLPVAEDDQLGKANEFWKLIEQGERTRKVS